MSRTRNNDNNDYNIHNYEIEGVGIGKYSHSRDFIKKRDNGDGRDYYQSRSDDGGGSSGYEYEDVDDPEGLNNYSSHNNDNNNNNSNTNNINYNNNYNNEYRNSDNGNIRNHHNSHNTSHFNVNNSNNKNSKLRIFYSARNNFRDEKVTFENHNSPRIDQIDGSKDKDNKLKMAENRNNNNICEDDNNEDDSHIDDVIMKMIF